MFRWVSCRMSADKALCRIRQLNRVLTGSAARGTAAPWKTLCSDSNVSIGDVSKIVKKPKNPELVPTKHLSDNLPQSVMRHLRWIMQKDSLGQDVFLIGPPGPLRRAIAMQYLELTKREVEYIALTRDTTESDLKQRREIISGTAFYIDQCAVKAATKGRVLILEGIEKAERNVLPVLNNLLENREMQLEDGRFLCAAKRYDKLLKGHSQKELDAWKLVRVSEDFRVIALGLPVPRYRGNPLDPPLRSRFQARDVNPLSFKDQLEMLQALGPRVSSEKPSQMLSYATLLRSSELSALGLPDFPLDNLNSAIKIMNAVPRTSVQKLLHQLYPYTVFMGTEGKTTVYDALKKFELLEDPYGKVHNERIVDVQPANQKEVCLATATAVVESKGQQFELQVPVGTQDMQVTDPHHPFIITSSHEGLLADMMMAHTVQDFCLIGPKGCGKSILAKQFANSLGYNVEPVMLYQDMTSRDLLQQRATLPNGDTRWRMSPLIRAALEGSIALLDGVHRVNPSTLAVLHRLVHDREISLFDGTKLLRHDRYDAVKKETSMSDEEMKERFIFAIHPSFRIIALSEPPVVGSSTQQWLNPELLTLFLFHHVKPLSYGEELKVVQGMVPQATEQTLEPLLKFTHILRNSADPTLQNLSSSLSTRNLLRIVNRTSKYPEEVLYEAINKACLSRFLPQLAHQALDKILSDNDIHPRADKTADVVQEIEQSLTCEVKNNILRIGHTTMPVFNPNNGMMVPDTLFYENPQHLAIMEYMLKDFSLGEHLLLIGNQGVGKNKIADRFLHLLNKSRQYLQLHRDTTVQTLTLQPNVQDGVIVYEDSPLVKAVKLGHVLVVDEADKAPTNVTCILKSLVESGEMILADGRKIVSGRPGLQPKDDVIITHPDFRMIVLANRPGFPFLGNDFFGALGDIFSCHAVDNPNIESEMQMLSRYGPDVPEKMLRKLVLAFSDLRNMADQGMIAYPYSTREVVNMVKHLQQFPDEGLATVVNNVFDFDAYNTEMREQIVETLHKHGIPLGANPAHVHLAKEYPLPAPVLMFHWKYSSEANHKKILCPVEDRTLRVKGPVHMDMRNFPLEKVEARSTSFTEQLSCWNLPMSGTNIVVDVAMSQDPTSELLHIATCSPVCLYTMKPHGQTIHFMDMYGVFPGLVKKKVKIAALGPPLNGQIIMHEEAGNVVLLVDTNVGSIHRLFLTSVLDTAKDKLMKRFSSSETEAYKMCGEFSHENWVAFYQQGGNKIDVLDVKNGSAYSMELPIQIASLHLASADAWFVTEMNTEGKHLLTKPSLGAPVCQLNSIREKSLQDSSDMCCDSFKDQLTLSKSALDKETLSKALGQPIEAPNRILSNCDNYGNIAVGFPELMSGVDVYTIPRPAEKIDTPRTELTNQTDPLTSLIRKASSHVETESEAVMLPMAGQVIRSVPVSMVPKDVFPKNKAPITICTCLEIVDLADQKVRYIPVPSPSTNLSSHMPWAPVATNQLTMATTNNEHLVTVDVAGCVRIWETGVKQLGKSLDEWYRMIGAQDNKPIQITREKELGKDINSPPKHGKIDASNNPHVGGNTWAGGTGGQSTAGLGGVGGPYRLDAGHDVTQVSEQDKANVPLEILAAAREMAQKAFKERLREIEMSEYDAEMYEKFSANVRRQVKALRVILDSLQAKGKERQWMKHQSSGELDEAKLIEGLTGEKAIYKRRGDKEPEPGTPQVKPKRLRFVVDVSGSMYRFNSYDGRLDRVMESTLMIMEAFEKSEEKFTFDIVGHSGEDFNIVFVNGDKPPKNNKERLSVIKKMHAHAQFCMSGDNTLEAAKFSIEDITNKEGDEYFVIILSDANLDRYAISPVKFSQILNSDEQVNAYALFIGSLGDQADRLVRKLPAGKAFVCMDLKNVPQILQQIFTSTFLSSS